MASFALKGPIPRGSLKVHTDSDLKEVCRKKDVRIKVLEAKLQLTEEARDAQIEQVVELRSQLEAIKESPFRLACSLPNSEDCSVEVPPGWGSNAKCKKRTRLGYEEAEQLLTEEDPKLNLLTTFELPTPDQGTEVWLHPPTKKKRSNRRSSESRKDSAEGCEPCLDGANPLLSDDDDWEDESEGVNTLLRRELDACKREVEDLKQRLANQEREAAVRSQEVASAKEELRQYKLRNLESVVSQRAAHSDSEAVQRDLARRSQELAEVKVLLEKRDASIEDRETEIGQIKAEVRGLRVQNQASTRVEQGLGSEITRLEKANRALEFQVAQLMEKCCKVQEEKDALYKQGLEEKTALRLRLSKSRSRLNRVEGIKIPTILENHAREVSLTPVLAYF